MAIAFTECWYCHRLIHFDDQCPHCDAWLDNREKVGFPDSTGENVWVVGVIRQWLPNWQPKG